ALQPVLPPRHALPILGGERGDLRRRPGGAHPRGGGSRPRESRPLSARLHGLRGAARHLPPGVAHPHPPPPRGGLRLRRRRPAARGAGARPLSAPPLESLQPHGQAGRRGGAGGVDRRRAGARLHPPPRRVLLALRLEPPYQRYRRYGSHGQRRPARRGRRPRPGGDRRRPDQELALSGLAGDLDGGTAAGHRGGRERRLVPGRWRLEAAPAGGGGADGARPRARRDAGHPRRLLAQARADAPPRPRAGDGDRPRAGRHLLRLRLAARAAAGDRRRHGLLSRRPRPPGHLRARRLLRRQPRPPPLAAALPLPPARPPLLRPQLRRGPARPRSPRRDDPRRRRLKPACPAYTMAAMPNRSRPSFPYLLIPCLLAYGALRIAAAAAPATTPATPQTAPAAGPWTRGAVLYTVFVPSFADSNGDGRGDLPGLLGELDYLNDGNPKTVTDLGVDALWLRGIAHPTAADPDLGRVRAERTQRGLRIVVEGLDELPVRLQPDLAAEIVAGVKTGEASGIARRLAGLAAAETGGPVEALL